MILLNFFATFGSVSGLQVTVLTTALVYLGLGEPEARLKKGPQMTSLYSANRDTTFRSSLGRGYSTVQLNQGYVPETTA